MKTIFIHGLGQNANSWNDTISYMKNKESIVCINLFELIKDKELNYNNLYNAFCDYCKEIQEPFNICGLSLGGVLSLQYASENPNKVYSMILIGTQFNMPTNLLKFQNLVFKLLPNSSFNKIGISKKNMISFSKSLIGMDLQKNLTKITCKTLVVCGGKDNVNKKASILLNKHLKNSQFLIIEGAGHEVNEHKPKELSILIDNFFSNNK